jgi:hypothetical protein
MISRMSRLSLKKLAFIRRCRGLSKRRLNLTRSGFFTSCLHGRLLTFFNSFSTKQRAKPGFFVEDASNAFVSFGLQVIEGRKLEQMSPVETFVARSDRVPNSGAWFA